MAYFRVHSLAVLSYRDRSVLYTCAISGTSGSSGLGSVNIEQMLSKTVRRFSKRWLMGVGWWIEDTRVGASGAGNSLDIPLLMVRAGLH